jgi:hypothetical protein
VKLTDTHLALLPRATQRDDGTLDIPSSLKGRRKIVDQLLATQLIEEVLAHGSQPVWRRDEQERALALIVTDAGLKALRAGAEASNTKEKKSGATPQKTARAKRPAAAKVAVKKARTSRGLGEKKPGGSKQDRIIALLRQPKGTTIAGIMKATDWQQHSVRGFFASTLRKKLKLNLVSEKVGEEEIARLPDLGLHELRRRWQGLYRQPAPKFFRRNLLVRGIAYQMQVEAYGGLSPTAKRRLREIAEAVSTVQAQRHVRGIAAPSYDLRGRANNAAQTHEAFYCDNQDDDDADLNR